MEWETEADNLYWSPEDCRRGEIPIMFQEQIQTDASWYKNWEITSTLLTVETAHHWSGCRGMLDWRKKAQDKFLCMLVVCKNF